MTIPTAQTIITAAMKAAGILGNGQTLAPEDNNDGFDLLCDLIAQWERKRWLNWSLVDTPLVSTGALSYTVGIGGNFNIPRPDRLESAFLRQVIPASTYTLDFPIRIIPARETYNQITLKDLTTLSRAVFYDSAYPLGNVFFWPVANASMYEMHITTKSNIPIPATLASTFSGVPPEYVPALKWNLTRRVRAHYRRPPDQEINALAKDALNTIRMANAQVPLLNMPDAVVRGSGVYDPFSDRIL
jgi:hypothetical protein